MLWKLKEIKQDKIQIIIINFGVSDSNFLWPLLLEYEAKKPSTSLASNGQMHKKQAMW